MTECIVCSSDLYVQEETEVRGIVLCDACGIDLEVAEVYPELVFRMPEDDIYWGE